MKKMNKKGFTIVELVIVIAVIAILAGVMIPTFTGIVKKAQDSSALQEARTIMTEYIALKNGAPESLYFIKTCDKDTTGVETNVRYFKVESGKIEGPIAADKVTLNYVVVVDSDGDKFPNTEQFTPTSNTPNP